MAAGYFQRRGCAWLPGYRAAWAGFHGPWWFLLLIELARLVDEGHLRPQVGAVYPLADAAKAFSAKVADGIPGRFVLQP